MNAAIAMMIIGAHVDAWRTIMALAPMAWVYFFKQVNKKEM